MSSFGKNSNDNDDDVKALADRLNQLKYPSGKEEVCSLDSLQSRYEALRGPQEVVSLDDLHSRFEKLEGNTVQQTGQKECDEQFHRIGEDDEEEEDDDFMNFINENLSMSMDIISNSKENHNFDFDNYAAGQFDESRLQSMEEKSESLLQDVTNNDNALDLEASLGNSEVVTSFISENLPVGTSARLNGLGIPQKNKSEVDMLIEQVRDESRLLYNPVKTTYAGPSGELNDGDQVSQLIKAARDAAYLEKKYGGSGSGSRNSQVENSKKATQGDTTKNVNDDDISDGERSYGSLISDDSTLSDSD